MGVECVLEELRQELKSGSYRPLPARERLIPKRSGKLRSLGIPPLRDRIVQMAAKLVLEPVFEADFCPTSYGFRPGPDAEPRTPSNRCGSSSTTHAATSGR
jgi:RNA-directed DNA polymerase